MFTDYQTAVEWRHNSYILCTNLPDIDEEIFADEEFLAEIFNEETEEFSEIYQFYLSDCSDFDVNFLREHFEGLIFYHSEKLELWVLCVDHYGTGWDYVPVHTDLPWAAKKSKLRK